MTYAGLPVREWFRQRYNHCIKCYDAARRAQVLPIDWSGTHSYTPNLAVAAAEDAIMAAGKNDIGWRLRAFRVVQQLARTQQYVNADDVWQVLKDDRPDEPRALGPVMRTARKHGLIHPVGARRSLRREGHGHPHTEYESLIYR